MIEALLDELDAAGWTVSWAFQFAAGHWRASLIRIEDVGEAQGTYVSHCADAPTLREAIEDAFLRRNEAEFILDTPPTFAREAAPSGNLLTALGLAKPPPPIVRRF